MGVPSVFLRTFGCNFTCDGFGMNRGERSNERNTIAESAESFKSYQLLPLVSTGCDSYASWDPRFKHLSPVLDTDTIADTICDILPHGHWQDEHLVITGGEPLLGWQKQYPDLLSHPKMAGLKEITFETNGTQKLTPEFKDYLNKWSFPEDFRIREITFSVSAKLPASGEAWDEAICPEVVCEYETVGTVYLKLVVSTVDDILDAERAVKQFKDAGFKGHIYLMPVGGVESVYTLNAKNVALAAMNRGWRYSDRLQVPLFKNEWGT
jgi:organic radical activating enzyme